MIERFWVDCQCTTPEHSIRFDYDLEYNEVYVTTCLRPGLGFWERLRAGIGYILGLGDATFEDTVIRPEDVTKIKDLFEKIEKGLDKTQEHGNI